MSTVTSASGGGPQYIRFRHPTNQNQDQKSDGAKTATKWSLRHNGILQDQLRRSARPPWCPSFSLALRMLLLVRVSGAMYSNISDCDEVFNFWEPLHYFVHGYGFQTWEVTPLYAIRSWAYILMHMLPVWGPAKLLSFDKRQSFFALRVLLAFASSYAEATLYRAVVDKINYRVGRYFLFATMFSAGMWNASTAFLPSSFAMYTTALAFAYSLDAPSLLNRRRTLVSTLLFATGGIVGWPFALALAIPFVLEELLAGGLDIIVPETAVSWTTKRVTRLFMAGATAALLFIPVVAIDSLAYGKLSIVPWNIVKYNLFGGAERGPELYGTEPWYFYILNLTLNFNILVPLALLAWPALYITSKIDKKRVAGPSTNPLAPGQTSPARTLAIRLAPFYVWFAILTSQAHKEERFMFPAYPVLLFNAAVTVYLIRGWVEVVFVKVTKSPYQASQSSLFRLSTLSIMAVAIALSISRILAMSYYYHAPLQVYHHLQLKELPRVLNVTGLSSLPSSDPRPVRTARGEAPPIDLTPISQLNLTLCTSKEWYRFPSSWLVPHGIKVGFVKSEFDGLLPHRFEESVGDKSPYWRREKTWDQPQGLNDLNMEDPGQYVNVETCDYLVDLDFPSHPSSSVSEPRYAADAERWDRVYCAPFLDAAHSSMLTRTLWVPGQWWQESNSFGLYCLLKRKGLYESD